MRLVAIAILLSALSARADAPHPLARLTPPEGKFFDDPLAISSNGDAVAVLATDLATEATLSLWDGSGDKDKARPTLAGLPSTVVRTSFLTPTRLLVVYKQGDRLAALTITRKGDALSLDRKRLGPADGIDAIVRDGKPAIALYEKHPRSPGTEHSVTVLGLDGHVVGKRTYNEDGEGLVRTRAGSLRPLWWSAGHTVLSAQKIGSFDKAKDMRRPDRFVRLDVPSDKILVEQEIEDLMAFAKVTAAHRQQNDAETFVRLSDDGKQIIVVNGLAEQVVPLARPIVQYDLASLASVPLGDHELLVKLQVDPANASAVARHGNDPDDIDLYKLDLSAPKVAPSAPRVMVLPGTGRPAGITASESKLVVLRKDKGFDRGGVAVELYSLP
ncbi:MAG: hypothetical protein ABI321_00775 [Polyangia bacterium]